MQSSTKPRSGKAVPQKPVRKSTIGKVPEAAVRVARAAGTVSPPAARTIADLNLGDRPKIVFDAEPTLILAATNYATEEGLRGVGAVARKALIRFLKNEGYLA